MKVTILLLMPVFLCGCGGWSTLPIKTHREYREIIVEAIDSGWVGSKYPDEVLIEDWPELYVVKYGDREMRSYVKFPIPIFEKGERVESVSLNARLNSVAGTVYPIWIGIHRTTNEWKGNELTWNNQPGFEDELLGITPYYAGEPGPWAYWELDIKKRDFNEEHLSIIIVLEEEVTSEISFTMNPFLIFITYR